MLDQCGQRFRYTQPPWDGSTLLANATRRLHQPPNSQRYSMASTSQSLGVGLPGHLLQLDDDELGRLEGGEADHHHEDAAVDVAL